MLPKEIIIIKILNVINEEQEGARKVYLHQSISTSNVLSELFAIKKTPSFESDSPARLAAVALRKGK